MILIHLDRHALQHPAAQALAEEQTMNETTVRREMTMDEIRDRDALRGIQQQAQADLGRLAVDSGGQLGCQHNADPNVTQAKTYSSQRRNPLTDRAERDRRDTLRAVEHAIERADRSAMESAERLQELRQLSMTLMNSPELSAFAARLLWGIGAI